jgi:hypothetical protein
MVSLSGGMVGPSNNAMLQVVEMHIARPDANLTNNHDLRSGGPCSRSAHSPWPSCFRQMSVDLHCAVCIVGMHKPNQCAAVCWARGCQRGALAVGDED